MLLTNKSVSVVLGVYNQANILERTLPIWAAECISYREGSELIICDDGSTDNTSEVVDAFMEKMSTSGLRIVYLKKERAKKPQLSKSLNMALPFITARFVLFAMGDSYPAGHILSDYKPFLDEQSILSGLRKGIKGPFNYSTITKDYRTYTPQYTSIGESNRPWLGFTGNNFVMPFSMLSDMGGWNEGFQGYGAEDWELAAFAYFAYSAKFVPVPDACVYHITHEVREGSGDANYYLAKWVTKLIGRYSTGDFRRSTAGFKIRG